MKRLILPFNLQSYWNWLHREYSPTEGLAIHETSSILLHRDALVGYRDMEMWVLPGAAERRDYHDFIQLAHDRNITVIQK